MTCVGQNGLAFCLVETLIISGQDRRDQSHTLSDSCCRWKGETERKDQPGSDRHVGALSWGSTQMTV